MTALAAEKVCVRRGGALLLDNVALSARGGEFLAVVGPNGAGKTTLLRALAGIERPAAGRILLDGGDIAALSPAARARHCAYLPQTREIAWAMTVEAVVALGRYAYGSVRRQGRAGREAVDRALAAVGLDAFRARAAPTLSGGEAARMHLARALAAETPILLADEPTAALDLAHQLAIMTVLKAKAESGGLVLAALHDLDLARRYAARIVVLDAGRVAADAPPAEALSERLLGAVFHVARTEEGYAPAS